MVFMLFNTKFSLGQMGMFNQWQNKISISISDPDANISPKIDYSSSNVRARIGESVDLICVGQGYPPPVYKWVSRNFFDLKLILANKRLMIFLAY